MTPSQVIKIHESDNVAVAVVPILQDERIHINTSSFTVKQSIEPGHKIAIKDIATGEMVVKYGYPIGHATEFIQTGEFVHTHNIKTNLTRSQKYIYTPKLSALTPRFPQLTFSGYLRENGQVGVRNEIWIINTVGCVNKISDFLAIESSRHFGHLVDGIFSYSHPFGCSQLGEDLLRTQKILAGLVNHPNAAGVLVLGLGCENNGITELKKIMGDYHPDRVKFLISQNVADEREEGLKLIGQLVAR